MTRTTNAGLALLGFMVVALVVACALLVKFDRAGLVGAGIGAGLGLLNLALGTLITMRALRKGMQSAMRTLMGGFLVRLIGLVALVLLFHKVAWADSVAFALVFMIFFFAYVAVEILLVERSLHRPENAV